MDDLSVAERIIKGISEELFPLLNEEQRRIAAGSMARAYGWGGQTLVSSYTGLARNTVSKGSGEAQSPGDGRKPEGRIRRKGGGRKAAVEKDPSIARHIEEKLYESTYGDPDSLLVYTSLSIRGIARWLRDEHGIIVSHNIVGAVIEKLHYSRQKNRKLQQVTGLNVDPDERDAQFRHINDTAKAYMAKGLPVISIDCKKKEVLGNLANSGSEYRRSGDPRPVKDHDFEDRELGKIAPYGIWVENNNTAFVNLGTSSDTAEFAAQSIRVWWYDVGIHTFAGARKLYITADGGGSNGSRSRLWKSELARLAEETGLEIEVSHFPPGTSKWNKVEHRLFSYITRNWAGKPLTDIQTAVKLIGSTTTTTGLKVVCKEDPRAYETGIRITDEQMACLDIDYLDEGSKWNYVVKGLKASSETGQQPAKRKRGRPRKNPQATPDGGK